MATQAALGSDIALVFDECTPFHVDREYTRALDRAHAPLADALLELARREGTAASSSCTGSCREACTRRCDVNPRRRSPQSGCGGIAIGGSLGAEKAQMHEVVEWAVRGARG